MSRSGETGANSGSAAAQQLAVGRHEVAGSGGRVGHQRRQVDGRDEQQHGVGLVDRRGDGGDQPAEREAHQPDGLVGPLPQEGEELADVPHRLGEAVDGVEDVGAGHRRGQARPGVPPAVERQREEGQVEPELAVEVQGAEGAEVEPGLPMPKPCRQTSHGRSSERCSSSGGPGDPVLAVVRRSAPPRAPRGAARSRRARTGSCTGGCPSAGPGCAPPRDAAAPGGRSPAPRASRAARTGRAPRPPPRRSAPAAPARAARSDAVTSRKAAASTRTSRRTRGVSRERGRGSGASAGVNGRVQRSKGSCTGVGLPRSAASMSSASASLIPSAISHGSSSRSGSEVRPKSSRSM